MLLVTGLLCLGIVIWAMAGPILRNFHRPPGDGKHIESYGFDLSNLAVPRGQVVAKLLYRDMVPVMVNPTSSGPTLTDADDTHRWDAMQRRNDPQYGKYLVSSDLVIGVEVAGESRAYPISVMYVHEIINDTLGGVPIAVTHNWMCGSTCVFDRRINGSTLEFHVSGLVYNSNLLMYDKHSGGRDGGTSGGDLANEKSSGESLWSQLLARAISGPAATSESTLERIPYQILTWADWQAAHPHTTVLDRNVGISERYKQAAPTTYFQSDELWAPVNPMPPVDGPPIKSPVIAIEAGSVRRVYPISYIMKMAADSVSGNPNGNSSGKVGKWSDTLGSTHLLFTCNREAQTVDVEHDSAGQPILATHAFWFAWHAMFPQDELAGAVNAAAPAGASSH